MGHNKKNGQHVVPKTYLKHWKIEPEKNFVYGIDFSNKYRKGIQRFGLNDKVFKEEQYYNDNKFVNPYILEEIFGNHIEPTYNDIMNEINKETDIPKETREKIMQWLYVSKMRSPYMRNNIEHILNFLCKASGIFKEKENEIEGFTRRVARQVHLNSFIDKKQLRKLMDLHVATLNAKQWIILKSKPEFKFWTNDNPGFSPNMDIRLATENPYHRVMEMNANSFIFFPLSPKYCLEISPFYEGTPLNVTAINMKIEYKQATLKLIDFINRGIYYTKNKILISNDKESLEKYIKRN